MRSLIVISLLSLLLSACGQTGPLYLPKDEPAEARAPTTTDQPVTEESTPEKQEGL